MVETAPLKESPELFFRRLIHIKLNSLNILQLRAAKSFSITVNDNFRTYVSLRPHVEVKASHGIRFHDIVFEGRTHKNVDTSVDIFTQGAAYPQELFKTESDRLGFQKALAFRLKERIHPKSEHPWTFVR
jgi:hypothetical protein